MMYIQIEDVHALFNDIDKLRANNWLVTEDATDGYLKSQVRRNAFCFDFLVLISCFFTSNNKQFLRALVISSCLQIFFSIVLLELFRKLFWQSLHKKTNVKIYLDMTISWQWNRALVEPFFNLRWNKHVCVVSTNSWF